MKYNHTMERSTITTSTYGLLIQLMMQSKHQLHAVVEPLGLSLIQAQTLMMLGNNPMTMSTIGRALACDASNVTGIIDRLEIAGLIDRRYDETDRRVKLVALSHVGSDTRAKIMADMTRAEVERVGPALSQAEVETLNVLLKKLVDRSSTPTG